MLRRPIAGSLTEARGQKANMHVFKEMLELCQIINSEGYNISDEQPSLRFIPFGELFNVKSCFFSIQIYILSKLLFFFADLQSH